MIKRVIIYLLAIILIFNNAVYAQTICKENNCSEKVYKEDLCKKHYKINHLKDIAINYVIDQVIPFGLGSVARESINILLEDDDKENKSKGDKTNEKEIIDSRFEKMKFGKIKFPVYDENGNIKKYKTKDIDWYVLAEEDNKKLLLATVPFSISPYISTKYSFLTKKEANDMFERFTDGIYDDFYYGDDIYVHKDELSYKDSYLRKYLNEDIYKDCFNEDEKKKIAETEINTIHYTIDNKVDFIETTTDKIFEIGIDEFDSYIKNKNITYNTFYNFDEDYKPENKYELTGGYGEWLRDVTKYKNEKNEIQYNALMIEPGYDKNANENKEYIKLGSNERINRLHGIRPMIWVEK